MALNYLEGVALLLLMSATWNASFSLYCCHLPGMAVSLLWTSATWKDWLFSFLTSATWKTCFSLHCHQLSGEIVFSLIDVSYLEGLSFLFIDASYLTGLPFIFIVVTYLKSSSFLLLTSATWTWNAGFSCHCRQSSTTWRCHLFSKFRQLPGRAGFYSY
jgi:hypothetical protein